MKLNDETLLSMYRMMVLLRRFEEKAGQAYGQKKIQGFCHLYIGQEAVAVGAQFALQPDDYMLTGYRDHAHPIARGADPGMIMAELFGRYGGYSKGRGGSMHLIDVEHHFYGGYGIVGGQIPLAAGMAFAARYRGEDRVTICFFGDAAANQGAFHETFNMAAKWKLPVIYVCENNRYGMGTDIARVSGEPEIYKRASAYQMRGEAVDGMDVVKVHDVVKDLADHCRAGKGPVLLEANCYRYRGHSMSDAATYRTKEEVEAERAKNDPIARHRELLVKRKLLTDADAEAIQAEVNKKCDEAVAFADASPEPPMEELYGDLWVNPGDADEHPRARVLGANVKWPSYPSGSELKVEWDLEPREKPSNVSQLKKKGGGVSELAYREALQQALAEEMERDANVFLMGEEVARYNGAYKVSQGLLDKFGSARVVDAPISELGFAGLGVGAAMVGLRPVIEMMTWNFAILAMDQIVNNAAKLRHMSGGQLRCPIVFRGPGGAGGRLSSQHSQALEANYVHFPGLKVVAPSTPADAKGLLKASIRDENPVIFIEGELLYGLRGEVPEGEHVIPIGVAEVKRPGKDVTLITWSRMLTAVVQPAVETLAASGIDVEVVDLRTLKPLDEETVLASVRKTNRVVIVEEGWPWCGVGASLADLIQAKAFDDLDAPVTRVTGLDINMAYAANLERATQPTPERVIAAVNEVLYRS